MPQAWEARRFEQDEFMRTLMRTVTKEAEKSYNYHDFIIQLTREILGWLRPIPYKKDKFSELGRKICVYISRFAKVESEKSYLQCHLMEELIRIVSSEAGHEYLYDRVINDKAVYGTSSRAEVPLRDDIDDILDEEYLD